MIAHLGEGAIPQDMPLWVSVFERLGPGSGVLLFVGAVVWKLLPEIVKLLRAWRLQSNEVVRVLPTAVRFGENAVLTLGRLADTMERGFENLNQQVYGGERIKRGAPGPADTSVGGPADR